jgi:iron complex transport system substrate-binding protein
MSKFVLLFFSGLLLFACGREKKNDSPNVGSTWVKYAKGFRIVKEGHLTHVYVTYPYQGASSGYHYILTPRGGVVPAQPGDVQVIELPLLTKIVCTSTTHIPHLDYLGLTDKLAGFPTTDYVSSEKMRARIDSGKVADLGIDKGMNLETLYSLHPSLVMTYTMSSDLGQLKKIQELGIPVVVNAEYLEHDPLGRAEWIKFTSLFFGKEREADSIFTSIEREYNRVKALTASVSERPRVMSGVVYGDTWFTPGGKNYASVLLKDAGCTYLWADNTSNGWLELSFESVFQVARDADFWIGVGSFNALEELKASEDRYSLFKPFQSGQVYNYNAKMGAKGGNDFLELGYLRPDLIVKDLVKITHPDMLPEHELYFHRKLK